MEYREPTKADHDGIRGLLRDNGWEKRVADEQRFSKMISNADRMVVAVEQDRVVGFARALCDDASNGYIGTVVVDEQHRGRGIGSEMVKRLMGDDPQITWVLRAGHGSDGFWEKMGFTRSAMAMERTRTDRS